MHTDDGMGQAMSIWAAGEEAKRHADRRLAEVQDRVARCEAAIVKLQEQLLRALTAGR